MSREDKLVELLLEHSKSITALGTLLRALIDELDAAGVVDWDKVAERNKAMRDVVDSILDANLNLDNDIERFEQGGL